MPPSLSAAALLCSLLLCPCTCTTRYFCDTSGRSNIKDADFLIVTRNESSPNYDRGMTCSFTASSAVSSDRYFIEVQEFNVSFATLRIRCDGNSIFYGSSIRRYQRSMMTTNNSLTVEFSVGSFASVRTGVELRVRTVGAAACPPGWRKVGNASCFGNSSHSGFLDYSDAQAACNNMRANLLLPSAAFSSHEIVKMWQQLNAAGAWIGITDRATRRQYRWLNGESFNQVGNVTCGGSCNRLHRCAAFADDRSSNDSKPLYSVQLLKCGYWRRHLCYMPPGGSHLLFPVPELEPGEGGEGGALLSSGAAAALLIGISLCCCGCCCGCCYYCCKSDSSSSAVAPATRSPPPPRRPSPERHVIVARQPPVPQVQQIVYYEQRTFIVRNS